MIRRTTIAILCGLLATELMAQVPTPKKIAASGAVLFAADDGRVYASGEAETERGDLNDTPRNYFLPIEGLEGIESVHLVLDSWGKAAAIDQQSKVWIWGRAWTETLHEGDKPELYAKPTHVPALDGTVAMALGSQHLITIDKNRRVRTMPTVYCGNETGYLGTGDTQPRRGVVTVTGIDDAVQVEAIDAASFILRADGSVWGMGSGAMGMLGRGARQGSIYDIADDGKNSNPRPIPIQGLRNIKAISVGTRFGIALDNAGGVWGWGINDSGQLGPNTNDLVSVRPTRMRGLKPCIAIAAGYDFMLAVQKDGTVMGQGGNVYGALGDKRSELEGRLRQIRLPAAAKTVYAGHYNGFAELVDGQVYGWGANDPTTGGFHPRSLFMAIPPTKLHPDLRPEPVSDVVKAGGARLVIQHDGDIEAPEQFEVYVNGKLAGKLVVNSQQASDEFKLELPTGMQRYRIKGTDSEGTRIDNEGLVIVAQNAMQNRVRKNMQENGLIAAVKDLKKQIDAVVPNFTPSTLDLTADGPMSEEALKQCEAQLGKPLPKSYRTALKTIGPFRLGPANAELPLVALYKPEASWTIGKWIDQAVKSSGQESKDVLVQEINEEIDIYNPSFNLAGGKRLRQQQLLVGASVGHNPYLLSPALPACDDGSMAQLWPEFFEMDIEGNEEWPSFGWIKQRDCDLAMLGKLMDAVEVCVCRAYQQAGVAVVIGKPDGTLGRASVLARDDGGGFQIGADGWFE